MKKTTKVVFVLIIIVIAVLGIIAMEVTRQVQYSETLCIAAGEAFRVSQYKGEHFYLNGELFCIWEETEIKVVRYKILEQNMTARAVTPTPMPIIVKDREG